MTAMELKAARDFWSQLTETLKTESKTKGLTFKMMPGNATEVATRDGRTLNVRFKPEDDHHQLTYELEDGTLKELQFVLAVKPYFRDGGVNYTPEGLREKMIRELQAPR